MKRSEMINNLLEWVRSVETTPETDTEMIAMIIDKTVELGMNPPALPGKSQIKIIERCKWETE